MSKDNKVSNTDIRQALNILCIATNEQLREVEMIIEEELKLVNEEDERKLFQRSLDLIAYVGILPD